jgi:enoyl-CoA hydratase/carnithine racemase
MAMVTREMVGAVAVVRMDDGKENRVNAGTLAEIRGELAALEADPAVGSVVLAGGGEKFFCNGLDLPWMLAQNRPTLEGFLRDVGALLKETVMFAKPLIAAINGHAFGLGSIWACAADFRMVRADRGFVCFPEFDVNVP